MVTLRDVFWLGLFSTIVLAWSALYLMNLEIGLDVFGRPGLWAQTLRALCIGPDAGIVGWLTVWAMWAVMGVAMMLPTLVPTLATYDRFAARLEAPLAGQGGVVLGFLAVWAGFSVLAAMAQVGLSYADLLDDWGAASSTMLQGGLLLGAGAWQFTNTKMRCQSACLSPMSYFLGRFRAGFGGGLRMGVELGLYCLGCCWAIMALGFVGGVMNLAWMGLATLFMVFEKLPGLGQALRLPAGWALTISGLAVLATTIY